MAVAPKMRTGTGVTQGIILARLPSRDELAAYHLMDERRLVGGLVERAVYTADERRKIASLAHGFVDSARENQGKHGGIDAFMHEYGLSTEEGVILMCLAEALLRIPDKPTQDALIAEKIGEGKWAKHLGASESLFVNASTFGLMLTGTVVRLGANKRGGPASLLKRLVARSGEPVIRQALRQAMRILGDNFVLGRTIKEAIQRARPYETQGCRVSYDMLGEGARSARDAERYYARYMDAIAAISQAAGPFKSTHAEALLDRPGLSVKLSAIDPRFEPGKAERLAVELLPKIVDLAIAAREAGLTLTIDAEEQDRLDITLEMFGQVYLHPALQGWAGFGIAVQAYGRRALPALRWLRRLAAEGGRRIPVRLVKGAYWDSEIKWAQELGLADYPVFTRKVHTDVSYLAAMRFLLADPVAFFPQFASHNAHTVASAYVAAGTAPYEFQRLHGMGEALYDEVVGANKLQRPCRIYAPVGGHEELLAYLVRRLLENGANSSFVHRLADASSPVADIIRDPVEAVEQERDAAQVGNVAGGVHAVPKPAEIFGTRVNSSGLALAEPAVRADMRAKIEQALTVSHDVGPIISGKAMLGGTAEMVRCPHDRRRHIGTCVASNSAQIEAATRAAVAAQPDWSRAGAAERAECLSRAADLFEQNRTQLMAVIIREAGKTLDNALGDVREAVDFLRYYASETLRLFSKPTFLPGPTGERNVLELAGRGAFVAISPWNFPLAIFTGQVAAALAAGNSVLAKPAAQTPITAYLAVQLLHKAGVPVDVLQFLPGDGAVGAALVRDKRTAGVAFTGSNATAWTIQRALADRRSAIVPFIAETGGINAMIADSSALAEQVVRDVVRSAFDSAGQRCSAARVLFVQADVADPMIEMLRGATETLVIGDPMEASTDVGPVIDEGAQDTLDGHKLKMRKVAKSIVDMTVPQAVRVGTYVSPAVFEIDNIAVLDREIFGPILHVVRYGQGRLGEVIEAINATGFGLTLGLHSRIGAVADFVAEHARVGNLYVNRNQIGAVVGAQPFGGDGLSGTGPKAGGPHTLVRYATERVRSTDVTATGGNVQLLGLGGGGKG
jgi:RHH-type transcriptional regulator, proline utilization regulon repressor / proline dehydrogenase / delta 1-pyrroline-5-carboxylate dehydrogenase